MYDDHPMVFLDSVPIPVIVISDERIDFSNRAVRDTFGWNSAEIAGRPMDILHADPVDAQKLMALVHKGGKDAGVSMPEPVRCMHRDGRKFLCRVGAALVSNNGIESLVITYQDISLSTKLQEALSRNEEKYSRLLESIDAAYFELDRQGKFTFINGALRKGMGFSEDEIVGSHFSRFMETGHAEMVGRKFEELYATGKAPLDFDVEMIRKNGSKACIESQVSFIKDERGEIRGLQGIGREVSQQRQAMQALEKSEEKYGNLLEAIEASYFKLDLYGNITVLNGALCKRSGYSEEELKGMNFSKLVDKDTAKRLFHLFVDFYSSGKTMIQFEVEMITKEGEGFYVDAWVSMLRDEEGKPIGAQGIGHDITMRKHAKKALEESEERFRLHFDSISDVIYTMDRTFTITSISPSVERLLGYKPEEIIGKTFADLNMLSLEYLEQGFVNSQKLFSGQRTNASLYEFITKDGTKKFGEISGAPLVKNGKVTSVLCVARDVTERIKAENAMMASEKTFRDIFDNVSDYLYFHDLEGNLYLEQTNKSGRKALVKGGYEGVARINIKDLISPRYKDGFEDYLNRVKTKGRDEGYIAVINSQGEERVLEYRNSLVFEGGRPIGVRGSARDITDRIHAETELKRSEEKYRSVLKDIEDGYYEVDLKGNFTFFNDSMCRLLGYSAEEMQGMNNRDFTDSENAKSIFKAFNRVFKTGKPDRGFCWELVRKDRARVYVETSVSLIRNTAGNPSGFRGICRDITWRVQEEEERKKLESRLQQAQKMEAIGTLAGGVAHDLNNILSGLVSYPELILMDLGPDDPLRKPIATIQHSGEKAAAIVQDLLTLARRGVSTTEVLAPYSIVSDYMKSPEFLKLKMDFPGVKIEVKSEAELLPIMGSPFHLGKMIMNLVTNAAEAICSEGSISISLSNVYLDRPFKGYDRVVEGEYIAIAISDTGPGISEEDRMRIFEPFYTRKIMGRSGTGLGMTVVWGTIQDHHGYIETISEEGEGTTFICYLPATRAMIKERPSRDMKDYMGRGETVVIVDDIELQREIASRVLMRLGYNVISFPSGEDAVEYMKTNTADIMVLDMIMDPGIDGLETYRQVLQYHPEQKAVIASGYSETQQVREVQRLGAGAYIKKPYLIETLGAALRSELDK